MPFQRRLLIAVFIIANVVVGIIVNTLEEVSLKHAIEDASKGSDLEREVGQLLEHAQAVKMLLEKEMEQGSQEPPSR